MSSAMWHEFCGHGENFTSWINGDFSHCFEQIVVVCPIYAILAVFSTYYIAVAKRNTRGAYSPLPWLIQFRLLCVILLAVLAVTQVLLTKILNKVLVSYSDIMTSCVVCFSWLLHALYVFRLKYLYWNTWRGATSVVIVFLLSLISVAAQLHTNIVQRVNHSPSHNVAEEFCVYVSTFLQLSYLVTLVPRWERVTLVDDVYYRAINEDVDSESRTLTSSSVNSYSSIPRSVRENIVAESNTNYLSLLTFQWVQSLMNKGASKCIKNIHNIFLLPNRLNTNVLSRKFTCILTGEKFTNDLYEDLSQGPSPSSSISSIPEVTYSGSRKLPMDTIHKPSLSLLQALHRAFGIEYYLLGILKLLADCLGFAGPILLNLLVSYMETKSEPEHNGYIYAAGLFLSTLLGALFSSQFDYNCKVVGFKIRTAVITTIYRKTLSVSSVAMTEFTTGQITNFMSTDTDRIVNFCPSFHAVWSLPFQIGVSLYLLYQQVPQLRIK